MAPNVSFTVIPNIGKVINQNQGFVVEVEVSVPATDSVGLEDVKLVVTGVDSDIVVGVGINIPVNMSYIAIGTSRKVQVVFETADDITTGDKEIEFLCTGYLGGPEYLEVSAPPVTSHPVLLHEVFPIWSNEQVVEVNVVAE